VAPSADTVVAPASVEAHGRAPLRPPPARRGGVVPRWLLPALALLLPAWVVLVGPLVWTPDPVRQNVTARLQAPSPARPLGTDQFGRDVLARVLYGGRLSLGIALVVTLVTAAAGVTVGSAAAAFGGPIDAALMRLVDVLLAFPFLLAALAVAGLSGGGFHGVVLALGLLGWGSYARVARAESLRVRALPFVEAARSLGAGELRLVLRHVLPSAAPALIVLAIIRFAQTILAIAGLSFLGVGVQPPTPEWGAMLNEGLPFLERAPHLLLAPGLAVTIACLVVSLAGDALRQVLDPTAG